MSDRGGAFVPKYVQIMETLRQRIADGTYQVGDLLPSESKLVKEFGAARPTVVRALNEMQLLGEVEREHGRGTFVKAPASAVAQPTRPGLAILDRQEDATTVRVVDVGRETAPPPVARLLGVTDTAPVHVRRVVGVHESIVSDLVSLWTSLDVARATGLDHDGPLTVPVRRLLAAGIPERLARVDERLSARQPTKREVELLGLGAGEPVLSVLASVLDSAGRVVLVVEVVLPATLHELEDSYAL